MSLRAEDWPALGNLPERLAKSLRGRACVQTAVGPGQITLQEARFVALAAEGHHGGIGQQRLELPHAPRPREAGPAYPNHDEVGWQKPEAIPFLSGWEGCRAGP